MFVFETLTPTTKADNS